MFFSDELVGTEYSLYILLVHVALAVLMVILKQRYIRSEVVTVEAYISTFSIFLQEEHKCN